MNMVIPNEGKTKILEELFRASSSRESFLVDLFKNNVTVADASTAADFTIADFTGYSQVALARADFDAAVIVANVGEIETTDLVEFECTGGAAQTVYGWILRGATSGKIYAGQNFDVARIMQPGAVEQLDPFKIKCKTLTG